MYLLAGASQMVQWSCAGVMVDAACWGEVSLQLRDLDADPILQLSVYQVHGRVYHLYGTPHQRDKCFDKTGSVFLLLCGCTWGSFFDDFSHNHSICGGRMNKSDCF